MTEIIIIINNNNNDNNKDTKIENTMEIIHIIFVFLFFFFLISLFYICSLLRGTVDHSHYGVDI